MSIPSPFEFIPPQFHLASLFIVGVAGFFIVIGFTSAKPITTKSVTIKEDPDGGESIVSEYPDPTHTAPSPSTPVKKEEIASASANASASPSTPVGTPKKTPTKSSNQYGSVATPSGRRSARIAQKKPSPKKP